MTGASSGLGRHFAHVLSRAGATVAVAARRLDALHALAAEIASHGGQAFPIGLNVVDNSSVRKCINAVVGKLGPINVLVNNSGVTSSNALLDETEEQWDAVLDTNLKGVFLVSTEVVRHLREANLGGSIINVASILGLRQAGHVAPYAASKAGLVQLTKVMALEWARLAIRVNALAPGYIETDLNQQLWHSPAGVALVKRIPQRRLGQPGDLDGALLLLASDASRYMTGTIITIDGGHLVNTL